ncbi:MAG: hypothetical protein Ta2B_20260 [Termitinemataceae bacterium]|nr:MAG: hypothetical protein Ta2B_20260 [Termitinemataceae bacterium]
MTNESRERIIMAVIILISLSGMFFFAFLFWGDINATLNFQNAEPIATVIKKVSTVQRRPSDRMVWDRLINESAIYNSDTIHTDYSSAIRIELVTGDVIDLGENSIVTIKLNKNDNTASINLQSGNVRSVTASGNLSLIRDGSDTVSPLEVGTVYTSAEGTDVSTTADELFENPTLTSIAESAPVEIYIESLLSAPENLVPQLNSVIDPVNLSNKRNIVFSWSPVTGANGYSWTLINAVNNRIIRQKILREEQIVFSELNLFGRSKKAAWQVEPLRLSEDGSILVHGKKAESVFFLPVFQKPKPKQVVVIDE